MRRAFVAGILAGLILAVPFVMVEIVYVPIMEVLWIPLAFLALAVAAITLPRWAPSDTPFRTGFAFAVPAVLLAWVLSTGFLMAVGESQLVFSSGWYGLKAALGAIAILLFWTAQAVFFAALSWVSAKVMARRSAPPSIA